LGGVEQAPDAAGEVAFEAADGLELGLAWGVFAREVSAGLGVDAGAGEGDDVEMDVQAHLARRSLFVRELIRTMRGSDLQASLVE
jgi:hypothetical protein